MAKFLRMIALIFLMILIIGIFLGIMQHAHLSSSPQLVCILLFGAMACAFSLGGGGN